MYTAEFVKDFEFLEMTKMFCGFMLSRAGVTLASFPCSLSLILPISYHDTVSQLVESVTVSSSWLGLQIL